MRSNLQNRGLLLFERIVSVCLVQRGIPSLVLLPSSESSHAFLRWLIRSFIDSFIHLFIH